MSLIKCWITLQTLWELIRYDVVNGIFGFRTIHRGLHALPCQTGNPGLPADAVVSQMSVAFSLYWKPALCLQRSVVMARVLRKHGAEAHVVIGYRPSPFLSHAWVEIGNRVVNDPGTYPNRLLVLDRI